MAPSLFTKDRHYHHHHQQQPNLYLALQNIVQFAKEKGDRNRVQATCNHHGGNGDRWPLKELM